MTTAHGGGHAAAASAAAGSRDGPLRRLAPHDQLSDTGTRARLENRNRLITDDLTIRLTSQHLRHFGCVGWTLQRRVDVTALGERYSVG
eukprot:5288274-Pyramimonas_sp.AAC.1